MIDTFVAGLPQCARLMAHLPSLMIFDDHDVTDDWNLSADWELAAYGHPFSKRIIGNALVAYLLCQAWGNDPDKLNPLIHHASTLLHDGSQPLMCAEQDGFIDRLLRFQGWEFQVSGTPKLIVLDTRTRRWRSEGKLNHPSGLMDWEALMEMQQALMGAKSAVIISPAPMFGVKLIESIQKFSPPWVSRWSWMLRTGWLIAGRPIRCCKYGNTPKPRQLCDLVRRCALLLCLRHCSAPSATLPTYGKLPPVGLKTPFRQPCSIPLIA
ncbi:hypothetical protein HSBAA_04550 [Vreelandella sulfidaeris]|uniref:PhoD-like phosphatase metallophosphatase domain-containing protein n=1 Tax=Vreelandella sulfidaeris TaxID=115553 RepID=A0A455U329_9GAMM|nr:hypothetical protein HSBAA_04550 [Halomonas sulfidaeris]